MPVINQSSRKSRPPWVAELRPSRVHNFLLLAVGLATTRSLFILDVNLFWQSLYAAICLVVLATLTQKNTQYHRRLIHHRDGSWSLSELATSPTPTRPFRTPYTEHRFQLCQSGYRSPNLIVLVFAPCTTQSEKPDHDSSKLIRTPIWFDQIDSSDFSYLHLQLAYAATPLPSLKDRVRASLRYTRNYSFKMGRGDETSNLPWR